MTQKPKKKSGAHKRLKRAKTDPRRVSRQGRPRGPRRESTSEPRFVKVELYLEVGASKRILESRARYSLTLTASDGGVIEDVPVVSARVVDDPVEFRGRLPYGFVRRGCSGLRS